MACNCNNTEVYKSKATVAVNAGNTYNLISPVNTLTPSNTDKVSILITSISSTLPTAPVYITLNATPIQVLDKYGNVVYGNELRTRNVLRGYYGTNGNATTTTHLQLVNFPYGR